MDDWTYLNDKIQMKTKKGLDVADIVDKMKKICFRP